eukprot:2603993-Rhodomonas_salina.1
MRKQSQPRRSCYLGEGREAHAVKVGVGAEVDEHLRRAAVAARGSEAHIPALVALLHRICTKRQPHINLVPSVRLPSNTELEKRSGQPTVLEPLLTPNASLLGVSVDAELGHEAVDHAEEADALEEVRVLSEEETGHR